MQTLGAFLELERISFSMLQLQQLEDLVELHLHIGVFHLAQVYCCAVVDHLEEIKQICLAFLVGAICLATYGHYDQRDTQTVRDWLHSSIVLLVLFLLLILLHQRSQKLLVIHKKENTL